MAENTIHLETIKNSGYFSNGLTLKRSEIPHNQWYEVASVTLPKGIYYINVIVRFVSSSVSARRGVCITNTVPDPTTHVASSSPSTTYAVCASVISEQTYVRKALMTNNTNDDAEFYVYVIQSNGTGTTVDINGCWLVYTKLA